MGFIITFAQLGSGNGFQPFKTVKDYENFLGRINGFGSYVDTAIADTRQGIAAGITQPKILMERTLAQLEALIVKDAEDSVFFQPVTNLPADFSAGGQTASDGGLQQSDQRADQSRLSQTSRFYQNRIFAEMPHDFRALRRSDGQERYAYLVRHWTTTDLTPDEIHQIGLSEVRRIRGEMEKVKTQVGFKGDLLAFFDYVRTDAKFHPFKTEEEVLAAYRAIETRLQANLPKFFGSFPKSKFEVRATEKSVRMKRAKNINYPRPTARVRASFTFPCRTQANITTRAWNRCFCTK